MGGLRDGARRPSASWSKGAPKRSRSSTRAPASRATDERDLVIDDAGAGGDRVGGVKLRAVAFGDGGGDAALRPDRGGALANGRGGENGDRTRREFQRAEQAGQSAADDESDVGF